LNEILLLVKDTRQKHWDRLCNLCHSYRPRREGEGDKDKDEETDKKGLIERLRLRDEERLRDTERH